MTFVCVNDGVPVETLGLLHRACADRDIVFREVDASAFEYDVADRCQPGDLLYRPAVSMRATQVELFLHAAGVASFHTGDPFFIATNHTLLFEREGLPVPRTTPAPRMSRDAVRDVVERLGGFPVVLKVGGGEGGVGVMVLETWRSAFSILDHLWASGTTPSLMAFVPDALHWRVVVVGDRAVAAYRNVEEVEDFRTYASPDPADYTDDPDPALAQVAIRAGRALRRELVGVDLLVHPSGRTYLLEANFPCYFAQAQQIAGIDVAGAMVDHLVDKARALS